MPSHAKNVNTAPGAKEFGRQGKALRNAALAHESARKRSENAKNAIAAANSRLEEVIEGLEGGGIEPEKAEDAYSQIMEDSIKAHRAFEKVNKDAEKAKDRVKLENQKARAIFKTFLERAIAKGKKNAPKPPGIKRLESAKKSATIVRDHAKNVAAKRKSSAEKNERDQKLREVAAKKAEEAALAKNASVLQTAREETEKAIDRIGKDPMGNFERDRLRSIPEDPGDLFQ